MYTKIGEKFNKLHNRLFGNDSSGDNRNTIIGWYRTDFCPYSDDEKENAIISHIEKACDILLSNEVRNFTFRFNTQYESGFKSYKSILDTVGCLIIFSTKENPGVEYVLSVDMPSLRKAHLNKKDILHSPIIKIHTSNFYAEADTDSFKKHFKKYTDILHFNNLLKIEADIDSKLGPSSLWWIRDKYMRVIKDFCNNKIPKDLFGEEYVLEGDLHIVWNFYINITDHEKYDIKVMKYKNEYSAQFNYYYGNDLSRAYTIQALRGVEHFLHILSISEFKPKQKQMEIREAVELAVSYDVRCSLGILQTGLALRYNVNKKDIVFEMFHTSGKNLRLINRHKLTECRTSTTILNIDGEGQSTHFFEHAFKGDQKFKGFDKVSDLLDYIQKNIDRYNNSKCDCCSRPNKENKNYCPNCGEKL